MEYEGIAKHGEKAVEALMTEYAQLDEFKVFKSHWTHPHSLRKRRLSPF